MKHKLVFESIALASPEVQDAKADWETTSAKLEAESGYRLYINRRYGSFTLNNAMLLNVTFISEGSNLLLAPSKVIGKLIIEYHTED